MAEQHQNILQGGRYTIFNGYATYRSCLLAWLGGNNASDFHPEISHDSNFSFTNCLERTKDIINSASCYRKFNFQLYQSASKV